MKLIKQSENAQRWPRYKTKTIECRKRDLVVRITDWMTDKDEPAFDVEVYIGGVYDFNESKSFTRWNGDNQRKTRAQCKREAIEFASGQIARLL